MDLLKKRQNRKGLPVGFIKKKVKAHTVLETVFAMLVILISFGITMLICANFFTKRNADDAILFHGIIQQELDEIKQGRQFLDEEKTLEEHRILRTHFEAYEGSVKHVWISVSLEDSLHHSLAAHNEILYVEQED